MEDIIETLRIDQQDRCFLPQADYFEMHFRIYPELNFALKSSLL
jgi:hypothetical protein